MHAVWRHERRWLLGGLVVASALLTWAVSWVREEDLWIPGQVGDETPIRLLAMWCALGLGVYAGSRDRLAGTESAQLFNLTRPRTAFVARLIGCVSVLAAALLVAYGCSWFGILHPQPPGQIYPIKDRTPWTLVELGPRLAIHAGVLPALGLGLLAGRVLGVGCGRRAWLAMIVVGATVFAQAETLLVPEMWGSLRIHGTHGAWPSLPPLGTRIHWGVYLGSQALVAAPLVLAALAYVPRPLDADRGAATGWQRLAVLPFLLAGVWQAAAWAGNFYDDALVTLIHHYPPVAGFADGRVHLAKRHVSEAVEPRETWWAFHDETHRLTGRTRGDGPRGRSLASAGTSGTTAWIFLAQDDRRDGATASRPTPLRASRWWHRAWIDEVSRAPRSPYLRLLAAKPEGVCELQLSGFAHSTRWPLRHADGRAVSSGVEFFPWETHERSTWWLFFDLASGRLEAAPVADLAAQKPLVVQGPPSEAQGRMRAIRLERTWSDRRRGDVVSVRFDDGWRAWSPEGWGPVLDKPAGATGPDYLWAQHQVLREGEDPLDHVVVLLDPAGNRIFEHRYKPHTSDEKMAATGMQLAALGTPLVAALAARLWLPPREVLWQPLIASGNHDGLLFGVFGIGLVCAFVAWLRMRRLEIPMSLRRFWVGSVLFGGPAVLFMNVLVVTRRAWRSEPTSAPGGALPRLLRVPRTRLGRETSP